MTNLTDNPHAGEIGVSSLIQQARYDAQRLGELLEYYRPFLLIVAESEIGPRLRAKCDPEDVVQQTLGDAAVAFPQFSGTTEAEFSCWLRRMHEHNLNDALRRLLAQKRNVRREQPMFQAEGSVSFLLERTGGRADDAQPTADPRRAGAAFGPTAARSEAPAA